MLLQVVLPSPSRRVAQIVLEAAGRADVLRASARHKEVPPMTDKISQRPVPPLDPPERFAGGEVVAAARCPVDVSTYPRRHLIVVKHAGERQTFSVHEVAHNHVEWVGGQGHYDLGYNRRHPSHGRESGWAGMTTCGACRSSFAGFLRERPLSAGSAASPGRDSATSSPGSGSR